MTAENSQLKKKLDVIEDLNMRLQEKLIQRNAVKQCAEWSNAGSFDHSNSTRIPIKNGMEPQIVNV